MTIQSAKRGIPVGRRGQVLLALWSLLLVGVFGVAWMLTPDPRGFGTHQRLGLPPCTFQAVVDIPCPTCGMTTSFSHFIRGEMVASVEAHPAGFLLAGLCMLQIPWCWGSIYHRRLWGVTRPDAVVLWLLIGLASLSLAQWAMRLL